MAPPTRPAASAWRAWAGPAAFVAAMAAYCVGRSVAIDGDLHPWTNTLVGLVVLAGATGAGFDRRELGVEGRDAGRGLAFGAATVVVAAIGMLLVAVLPATRDVFADDRAVVSTGAMLRRTLVVIPLGTALLEEVVFRGVLLAWLARRMSIWRAAWWSSVLFGLWHIPPTLHSADGTGAIGDAAHGGSGTALVVVGVVVAMTGAGLALCWLRIRSRSLVAPFVAHWGINATAFAVAWTVGR